MGEIKYLRKMWKYLLIVIWKFLQFTLMTWLPENHSFHIKERHIILFSVRYSILWKAGGTIISADCFLYWWQKFHSLFILDGKNRTKCLFECHSYMACFLSSCARITQYSKEWLFWIWKMKQWTLRKGRDCLYPSRSI